MTKSVCIFPHFRHQVLSIFPTETCAIEPSTNTVEHKAHTQTSTDVFQPTNQSPKRPDSLILACNNPTKFIADSDIGAATLCRKSQKFLYRSNSSRTFKRPRPKLNLGYDFDQIYFISSNKDDEHYDSINVIDERRKKNFNKFDTAGLVATGEENTAAIYSEYCPAEQKADNTMCSTVMHNETRRSATIEHSTSMETIEHRCSNVVDGTDDDGAKNNDSDPHMATTECKEATATSDECCKVEIDEHNITDDNSAKKQSNLEQTTIIVRADIEDCGMRYF